MQYFRFNTELQASDAQNQALGDLIDSLPTEVEVDGVITPIDNSAYISDTECWDCIKQRTSNTDWVFAYLEASSHRGWNTVEIDSNLEWPSEEEE